MRRVITAVLPVPAPATISSGPSSCVTAARCSALSPSRTRSAGRSAVALGAAGAAGSSSVSWAPGRGSVNVSRSGTVAASGGGSLAGGAMCLLISLGGIPGEVGLMPRPHVAAQEGRDHAAGKAAAPQQPRQPAQPRLYRQAAQAAGGPLPPGRRPFRLVAAEHGTHRLIDYPRSHAP